MKKLWHRIWSKYHYNQSLYAFAQGNDRGTHLHCEKFCYHSEMYVDLGGNPDDVYD